MFSFFEFLRVLMLTKSKKINVGTKGDAHVRLQAVIQSQRIEISNQKHQDEKKTLEIALENAQNELRALKSTPHRGQAVTVNTDRSFASPVEKEDIDSHVPMNWKAPSDFDAEELRKRIAQEEEALALKAPLVPGGKSEDCELDGKMPLGPRKDPINSLSAERVFEANSRSDKSSVKTPAPAFKDFLKNKAGMTKGTSDSVANKSDEVRAPHDLNGVASEIEKSLAQLEININKSVSDVDYDLDFSVDQEFCDGRDTFDEDSIPVLTDKITRGSGTEAAIISQSSHVASSFTMSISALLSSWLLSISRKTAVAGAVQRTYLIEDPHENRALHLFADTRETSVSRSHCLTRLNDWNDEISVPQPGVFHVFRPKFVSSISKDSILLTRPQSSACFYKWVTPLPGMGEQTVLQAFVEKQLPYLHATVSKQVTDLWTVAREAFVSGIALSESSVSDLSAKNRIYESTKVLLTRPLLTALFSQAPGTSELLIDYLGKKDSIKQIEWSELPWFDYPPQIILFHLIGDIAASGICSLSSARVMGLLDKILMLSRESELDTNALMYIRLLDEHSAFQSKLEDASLGDVFLNEGTQVIRSETIDSDIYDNPGLEVFTREDGLTMVRGPLISRLSAQFSGLKANLKELGLFRPELDLICREIQAK